ncbi:MAG: type II toxin-antitoxin system YoeB family toxin [Veillonellaceae bacterium]|nr:type II toxin-antitoxin system YoeB family toxin [Veillonellaceae bacterium]
MGKPEPLKEDLSGYWSARIDKQNRLVFRISVEDLIIVQCGMHYKDK